MLSKALDLRYTGDRNRKLPAASFWFRAADLAVSVGFLDTECARERGRDGNGTASRVFNRHIFGFLVRPVYPAAEEKQIYHRLAQHGGSGGTGGEEG